MMNILVIVILLAMGYVGVVKKFFSSLLHLACVVAAGAIAFAFWEPLSYLVLNKAPNRGFFDFLEYSSWAIGLIVPFAVSLAVLRVATDKLAPSNAVAANVPDAIGGGICGIGSGLITAGIVVIAIGTMGFKPDEFGYRPVSYGTPTSLQRTGGLVVPVDRLVGGFYEKASEASFGTTNSLAKWRPEPWHAAEVMRITDKGLARNTAKPNDFKLVARYTVEAGPGENLLQDRWATRPIESRMLNGDPYPSDARIEGLIVQFETTMREPRSSFVAMTEGQVWIVAEDASAGERINLHPVAVIANPQGAETSLARFPFDSPNFAISSAGAAALPWAFEFIVPDRFEPIAIYIRNVRREIPPSPVTEFGSIADRDEEISAGTLIEGAEAIPEDFGREDDSGNNRNNNNRGSAEQDAAGIKATNQLPYRLTIQKGGHKRMKLAEDNEIVEGEEQWRPADLSRRVIDKNLRIDKFEVTGPVVMVQLRCEADTKASMFGQAMAAAERIAPPVLKDVNGYAFEPVGWVYQDRDKIDIRYTPGQTIRAMSELADAGIVMSSSRTDQELTLLFLCTQGTTIESYYVGNAEIFTLEEDPLVLDMKQN